MPSHRWRISAAAALGLAAFPLAAAELTVAERYPLRGQPTAVSVAEGGRPLAGVTVEALYRPNSETAFRELLPAAGDDGRVEWTPKDAGIVTLTARLPGGGPPIASRDVAVRYGGFPASGIVIMCLAGLLLFGGASFGLALLLRSPTPGAADELPST